MDISGRVVGLLCGLLMISGWVRTPGAFIDAAEPPAQSGTGQAVGRPSRQQAQQALRRAVTFFHKQVATEGGYVWIYSADLQYRQGEGLAYDRRIWIQPPGTPTVGLAYLKAYQATGEKIYLDAAREAAEAVVAGQLHSGGWPYSVTFDPNKRKELNFRIGPSAGEPELATPADHPGGWELWRRREAKGNITLLDDNTTQSAIQLLIRVDQALDFQEPKIHEAAEYALRSILAAQYPIGAWSHNYDRFPQRPPDARHYPVKAASYPEEWSKRWTKKFAGCYLLNDRITLDTIRLMLDAFEIYRKREYWESALRGGDFLLRAQMPEPQPAWAQGYNRHMQPVWDRAFEPPAISGLESQDVLETLLLLYRRTGKRRFLDAIPAALVYLRRSQLAGGSLARFYELRTNRPLYFDRKYRITYDRGDLPDHYSFVVNSRLEAIAFEYRQLADEGPKASLPKPTWQELAAAVGRIIQSLDERGAWTEPGVVRDAQGRKVVPPGGVISSQTFAENITILARFLSKAQPEN